MKRLLIDEFPSLFLLAFLLAATMFVLAVTAEAQPVTYDDPAIRVHWTGWRFEGGISTVTYDVTQGDSLIASGIEHVDSLTVYAVNAVILDTVVPNVFTVCAIDATHGLMCCRSCTAMYEPEAAPPVCIPGEVWTEPRVVNAERPLEGFGAMTPGGDYGPTHTVTTLDEFRAALGDNRTIEVEGDPTWNVSNDPVLIDMSNLTCRGRVHIRPAPGYVGPLVVVTGHDIILQDLDVADAVGETGDCLRLYGDGCYNIVVDGCTFAGAEDGNLDITQGAYDCTVQWCRFEDNVKSMLIGYDATTISVHHCYFDSCETRCPQVNGGLVDVVNCVIEGWNGFGTRIDEGGQVNLVNCVWQGCVEGREHRAIYIAEGELYLPPGSIIPPQCEVQGTTGDRFSAPMVTTMTSGEALLAVKQEAGAR